MPDNAECTERFLSVLFTSIPSACVCVWRALLREYSNDHRMRHSMRRCKKTLARTETSIYREISLSNDDFNDHRNATRCCDACLHFQIEKPIRPRAK